jgi:hypothetical protein
MADIEYKTPEDVREEKMRMKTDKAYTKSLRNTEEAPMKDPRDVIRGQRGYAKGGSVSSASKRADGCCTKGKTKGKYL